MIDVRAPHLRPRVYRRPDDERPYQQRGGPRNNPYSRDRREMPQRGFQKKNNFFKPEIKITNDMQVTDGKHKGVQLRSTESPKVRPTARRIRETLFKVLNRRVKFARFLDLCAGCGAVGVEAISRGALLSTFVERSAKMCSFIKQNLDTCEICPTGHGEIVQLECLPFIKRMKQRKRCWDIIFFDPPYDANYDEVIELISRGACIKAQGGILVIEHPAEMFFPQTIGFLTRRKVVKEGDTALTFYECWK
jgi:16S rRNA (guanine966-N2)-methyltransferase